MEYDICINPQAGPEEWSRHMCEQGVAAFHEMEEVQGELKDILETLGTADTIPAYMRLRFLEARAEQDQKIATAVFALGLREYLQCLKNQTLEERTLGILVVCRTLRRILDIAPKQCPNVVSTLVSKSLRRQFLLISHRFLEGQVA